MCAQIQKEYSFWYSLFLQSKKLTKFFLKKVFFGEESFCYIFNTFSKFGASLKNQFSMVLDSFLPMCHQLLLSLFLHLCEILHPKKKKKTSATCYFFGLIRVLCFIEIGVHFKL